MDFGNTNCSIFHHSFHYEIIPAFYDFVYERAECDFNSFFFSGTDILLIFSSTFFLLGIECFFISDKNKLKKVLYFSCFLISIIFFVIFSAVYLTKNYSVISENFSKTSSIILTLYGTFCIVINYYKGKKEVDNRD